MVLDYLEKKTSIKIATVSARDNLPGLVSNLTSNAINKFDRKISGRGAVRVEKGYLFRMKIWMILLIL